MNLKEQQPSAVTMDTGQAKHPPAKVNVSSRLQMALLIVLEKINIYTIR